jgi:hypothetical protein
MVAPLGAAEPASSVLRGTLIEGPALRLPDGSTVRLSADEPTILVLKDKRLAKSDFEAFGERVSASEFRINPIHTRNLFTYQNGQRMMITYWCDVCYIRTYSPGICWCCQDDTRLDLIDPATVDKK